MDENSSILEVRGDKTKKFNFHKKKENTIRSLSEVEYFLCQCHKAVKCGKIIKFFRN